MATLKKQGDEIGRIDTMYESFAYMSNGKVLRNLGNGWKIYSTLRKERMKKIFEDSKLNFEKMLEKHPAYHKLLKEIHKYGLKHRYFLFSQVRIYYNDPDGFYTIFEDGKMYGRDMIQINKVDADELCKLYRDYITEKELNNEPRTLAEI